LFAEVFVRGVSQGWFLSVPPSLTTHLLQRKVKHLFKFYVSIRVTSHALDPLPLSHLLKRDVLFGRPLMTEETVILTLNDFHDDA